ncbi:ABC transporter family protein [Dorcoceras hygrometricum]|uniref:ABC transporter family protein n=1 Tax=Dorcoceras hygrometricum TaxID=472368 RepID=A0A2Z7BED1_9LAMI|nr:ABC transporter family protein [Dorcoceras hygrometricum]
MTFRVVRTNQYNQDLGLIHSTNGNHLESPNEGSSIDHQVTIYLHAQNITMSPTNETCECLAFGVTVDYVWNSNVFYEVDVDFKTLSISDFQLIEIRMFFFSLANDSVRI